MSTFAISEDFALRQAPKGDWKWSMVASVAIHLLVFAWFSLNALSGSKPQEQMASNQPMSIIMLAPPPGVDSGTQSAHATLETAVPHSQATVSHSAPTTEVSPTAVKTVLPQPAAIPVRTAPVAKAPGEVHPASVATPATEVASTAKPQPGAATAATGHDVGAPLGVPAGTGTTVGGGTAAGTATASNPDGEKQMSDAIAAYRRAFIRALSNAKQYPEQARREGYSGRVVLTLTVRKGSPAIAMTGQSGTDVLDDMAMKMASQAAKEAKMPDLLHNADFAFAVPIRFELLD